MTLAQKISSEERAPCLGLPTEPQCEHSAQPGTSWCACCELIAYMAGQVSETANKIFAASATGGVVRIHLSFSSGKES